MGSTAAYDLNYLSHSLANQNRTFCGGITFCGLFEILRPPVYPALAIVVVCPACYHRIARHPSPFTKFTQQGYV